jgi:hypothetical protein
MLKFFNLIFNSNATKTLVDAGNGITELRSNQPSLAPAAFGGSVIAAVISIFISGYNIVDCTRYQTGPGQCKETIEKSLPGFVMGIATILGSWGAFNTFNAKLHNETTSLLPTRELVIEDVVTQSPLHPEVIKNLYAEGNSQSEVAKMLGISVYAVRKALKE